MTERNLSLQTLQRKSLRLILWILWLQVPLVATACLVNGTSLVAPLTLALVAAGSAEGLARWDRSGPSSRVVAGVALMVSISLIVAAFSGQKMQVDLHMYYFAALALLVATCDWRVIAAGAATVAVHHTVLNFLLPSLIYPGGGDFMRLALHAIILVVEAAVLIWLAHTVQSMFAAIEAEVARTEAASAAAELHHAKAISAAAEAEAAESLRQKDMALVAQEDEATLRGLAQALEQLAAGDLTYRMHTTLPPRAERLRTDFNRAIERLQSVMVAVSHNADATQVDARGIARAATDLSRRTEHQAANLEETAAALDEIAATVRKTADGANHAQAVVTQAKSDAEQSSQVVRDAVTAMSGIQSSSREINQIIGVIDEIAFQTNLLALNAGVEAARAGDAGRGFAVVASEVRALAQRSAEAAKQIKTLISTSARQVDDGVKLVGGTGEALGRISDRVLEINGVVSDIAGSAREQTRALDQVNTAVNQMDQVTQQNAAMVEEASAASDSLSRQTSKLAELIGSFKVGEIARAPAARPAARGSNRARSAA